MIPVRIKKKDDVRDNYTRLGEYIAAAKEVGEKLDKFWIVGCDAGDGIEDLDTALAEIESVRAMKPQIENKTYHLVVSFHAGEGEKLSADDLKDIERAFAKALGFTDHQRIVGTHINTDNFHMHVGYNMVNPHTMKMVTPWKDYAALEKTARAMEKKYGLEVDLGMSDTKGQAKGSQKARDFEANTWQQSFQNHVLAHREELLKLIGNAGNWGELHAGLAEFGIETRRRGNGLVFAQADGKQAMKASLLDRSASLPALEKRLGAFEPASEQIREAARHPKPHRRYKARPVTRHPATGRLWRGYNRARKRSTLIGRTIKNWKWYLLAEAYKDPEAFMLLLMYQELFHAIGSIVPGQAAARPLPPTVGPAMAHWRSAGWWAPTGSSGPQAAGPGCRLDDDGNLVVPFRDGAGYLRGVRLVDKNGKVLDIGDVAGWGIRHAVGNLPIDGHAVFVTADYNLAVALQRRAGTPVIVVAKPEAVPAMVQQLRKEHPTLNVTVATDTHLKEVSRSKASSRRPKHQPDIELS